MEPLRKWLRYYLVSISNFINSNIIIITITYPIFVLIESILSYNFRRSHLSPCTVDLDDETAMHFWTTNRMHRADHKPNLVVIHGYGGDPRWQFSGQVGSLSQNFNLYIPDLLFFGESYTRRGERSEVFQAKCVCEGLKRLGVERLYVYSVSYGGYVAYRMAEMYPEMVEKLVIVSSGIGASQEQIEEQVKNIGGNALDLLLPENPHDLRTLMNMSLYKFNPIMLAPDFFLNNFIRVTCKTYRKEKQELVEHLMKKTSNINGFPVLTQETLLIWGDKDKIFPLSMAYQLHRHLGERSRLEVIKNAGHAANIDSPHTLNQLIIPFLATPFPHALPSS